MKTASVPVSGTPRLPSPLRRVLIVTPHFPPTNAPDCQRVRIALPYLEEFGWEAHILAVNPEQVPHPQDPYLEQGLPSALTITRTPALYTSRIGLGNVGWRCLPFFVREGNRLLATQSFDLVFFCTTIFPVMTLGAYWQQRFGIPYVLDFQDPWRSDYHRRSQPTQPPGGWLKYGVTQFLAGLCEPRALRRVSQVISVSPAYPQTLQRRYSWLRAEQFTVLPFGAPEQDFEQLSRLQIRQSIFDPQDGKRHWVYVGRGGKDMAIALRALFSAIQAERERTPDLWQSIHLHFVGTSYAPAHLAVKTVEAIAQDCGVADLVTEHTQRIPYFEAQQVLVDSDAILLIGSDDPGYTASKLYPSILARKPILAIFHAQSSVVDILRQCEAGVVVTFTGDEQPTTLIQALTPHLSQLINTSKYDQPTINWTAFQPYTAREMTRKLCHVFDQSLIGVAGG